MFSSEIPQMPCTGYQSFKIMSMKCYKTLETETVDMTNSALNFF